MKHIIPYNEHVIPMVDQSFHYNSKTMKHFTNWETFNPHEHETYHRNIPYMQRRRRAALQLVLVSSSKEFPITPLSLVTVRSQNMQNKQPSPFRKQNPQMIFIYELDEVNELYYECFPCGMFAI